MEVDAAAPSKKERASGETGVFAPQWVPPECGECNKETGERCSTHAERIALILSGRASKVLAKADKAQINREVNEARSERRKQMKQEQTENALVDVSDVLPRHRLPCT